MSQAYRLGSEWRRRGRWLRTVPMSWARREISRRLIQEEGYRRLVVEELQHRAKNKLSTIHAVLHQVLHDQPKIWFTIDQRMRALSATDDLIAKVEKRTDATTPDGKPVKAPWHLMTYEFHLKPGTGEAPQPMGVKVGEPA